MKIDHIGVVVKNIHLSAKLYQKLFDLNKKSEVIYDPIQKVYVQFFENEKGSMIELIQPQSKKSPSYNALLKGGGTNHICYETNHIQRELIRLKKENCIIVCPPVEGAEFKKRLVAFVVHPLLGLIELVEYQK